MTGTDLGLSGGASKGSLSPGREEEHAVRLGVGRDDVGGHGNDRKVNDIRPLAEGRGGTVGGASQASQGLVGVGGVGGGGRGRGGAVRADLERDEACVNHPLKGSLGVLDIADLVDSIVDSLVAGLSTGAKISAGVRVGGIRDRLGVGAGVVGLGAHAEAGAATSAVTRAGGRAGRQSRTVRQAALVVAVDDIEPVIIRPVHVVRLGIVLDMAEAGLLVVDGLFALGVGIAKPDAVLGRVDALDDFKAGSAVLVIGVVANAVLLAFRGCPHGLVRGTVEEMPCGR